MTQLDPFTFSRFLVLIAHPDDEVNCAALLKRLIDNGKSVRIVLLTNGDAGTNADGRIEEMTESLRAIGLSEQDLVPLGITEKDLLANATTAYQKALGAATQHQPDCIFSLDYEGGHEGHDMASYIAHKVAQKLGAAHVVFPDYHFRNMQRYGQGLF